MNDYKPTLSDAWNAGFTEACIQWGKQMRDPEHPITRIEPEWVQQAPPPAPRTEDYTAEELFPNAESDDYFQCCQECGSNVLSNARWQAKHVSWHNKLLP